MIRKSRAGLPAALSSPTRRLACLALLLGVAGASAQVAQPQMRVRIDQELAELAVLASQPPLAQPTDLARLPEPVRRYFAFTRVDPRRPVRHAHVRFTGEVRLPQTGGRDGVEAATPWMAMTGTQSMALSSGGLGYVWDTRWTNPRFAVDVRDRYVNGQTHIWAVRDDGTTLIDEGDDGMARTYLIRFFAEATQAPTMLLPGAHLRWEAVDAGSARAFVRDGGVTASMLCRFDTEGALTQCESDDRLLRFSGDVAERWVPARWVMTRGNYREMAGLRLPTTMSVRWVLGKTEFEQVRETIEAVRFDDGGGAP